MIGARLVPVALLGLALAGSVVLAASSPRDAGQAQKELQALRAKIDQLQKRLAKSEASRSEAADALKDSERAISEANRRLRELSEQARGLEQRLESLRSESQRAEAAIKREQALLGRLLYRQYVAGEAEPLRLLLERKDPGEIARMLQYFGYISRARAEVIKTLRQNLERLQALTEQKAREAAQLAAITAEQAAQRRQLEREKRERRSVLARIGRRINAQRRDIGMLRGDETRIGRLIEQLRRIVVPPRSARGTAPGFSGNTPFERLKGRLRLPVRGGLASRFGSPRRGGGPAWKGIFIAAPAGAEVRAIAPGRVVFADWLRGFGNLLIIDHGDAYMSLYGNNETLYRRVGDPVQGGEPIASVGNSGGNADSGLYFELRHEGTPLDPLTWTGTP